MIDLKRTFVIACKRVDIELSPLPTECLFCRTEATRSQVRLRIRNPLHCKLAALLPFWLQMRSQECHTSVGEHFGGRRLDPRVQFGQPKRLV